MFKESLSLFETNTAIVRRYKFIPRARLTKLSDELGEVVKVVSYATVAGITESKLDDSINDWEICIERYNVIRRDWNTKGGSVVCYVSNKICSNAKIPFQTK